MSNQTLERSAICFFPSQARWLPSFAPLAQEQAASQQDQPRQELTTVSPCTFHQPDRHSVSPPTPMCLVPAPNPSYFRLCSRVIISLKQRHKL